MYVSEQCGLLMFLPEEMMRDTEHELEKGCANNGQAD
jgi:hypothetical protein